MATVLPAQTQACRGVYHSMHVFVTMAAISTHSCSERWLAQRNSACCHAEWTGSNGFLHTQQLESSTDRTVVPQLVHVI